MNDADEGLESPRDVASPERYGAAPATDEFAERDDVPQFGLVDVVEAFTAMRHEWRGQSKESRAVVESAHAAVASIREMETRLLERLASNKGDEARQFAALLAETDHQLTRAAAAAAQAESKRRRRDEELRREVQRRFEAMNVLGRWAARPLATWLGEQLATDAAPGEGPVVEGLNLVVARLRGAMKERQIERLDALGFPFDATTMNAIGTVPATEFPSGHVAEQIAPGYRWRGQLLKYADVRVGV